VSGGSATRHAEIKITCPRPVISGTINDRDVSGGRQYGPPVVLEVSS